jgi:hypothetical protein
MASIQWKVCKLYRHTSYEQLEVNDLETEFYVKLMQTTDTMNKTDYSMVDLKALGETVNKLLKTNTENTQILRGSKTDTNSFLLESTLTFT